MGAPLPTLRDCDYGLRQIERLVEDHGIDIGFAARDRRGALELIEPLLVNEDSQIGEAAILAQDRELAAVGLADAMRDVELDFVAVGQSLDRMADMGIAVCSGRLREFGHR